MPASRSRCILIADIGGTNARFALIDPDGSGQPDLHAVQQVATADHPGLLQALRAYLRPLAQRPQHAVLAVASAVTADAIKITNNPWSFSITELSRELGFAVTVINDFTAMSSVLPVLQAGDLQPVGAAVARPVGDSRCYAVVGPGTGLGVGGVMVRGSRSTLIESEGGHVGFAPANLFELELLRLLLARFGRVSVERLVSGSGLVNLYEAIAQVEGRVASPMTPAQISAAAVADPSGLCAKTLSTFAELLGSFSGDMALAFGAWDGVFLAGGVTQKLLPWITAGGFRRRFEDKGRHGVILKSIPTQVITHPQAGLLGAAAYALNLASSSPS